jgi:hypothetical protein
MPSSLGVETRSFSENGAFNRLLTTRQLTLVSRAIDHPAGGSNPSVNTRSP